MPLLTVTVPLFPSQISPVPSEPPISPLRMSSAPAMNRRFKILP